MLKKAIRASEDAQLAWKAARRALRAAEERAASTAAAHRASAEYPNQLRPILVGALECPILRRGAPDLVAEAAEAAAGEDWDQVARILDRTWAVRGSAPAARLHALLPGLPSWEASEELTAAYAAVQAAYAAVQTSRREIELAAQDELRRVWNS